uniref:Adenosine deaminase n=1 Tax=Spongospora subterranea TaxID=70186 RepID=A0A0H5RBJ0_9EUKA|eukprot:CRZ11585.1 hypothetical protein [Spongospora subterranea]
MDNDLAMLSRLPKVELHCHLDGTVRDSLIFDTAIRRGIPLPEDVNCPADLRKYTAVDVSCGSLTEFLKPFQFLTPYLKGDKTALRQMALDACEDFATHNIIYAEIRYSPHLFSDLEFTPETVVSTITDALREGSDKFGIQVSTILCALRHFPAWTKEVVDLAHMYREHGVVGIDLAGDERHSSLPHAVEFARAKSLNIHITAHAGEISGQEIMLVAKNLHAERIGHGYHCVNDVELFNFVKNSKLHMECCLTSSLCTRAFVGSLKDHPVITFNRHSVSFSLNTDDPHICSTNLNLELQLALNEIGMNLNDVANCLVNAVNASFIPERERNKLLQKVLSGIQNV